MGFLGSWRSIIRSTKNAATGVIDTTAMSNKVLEQAKHWQLDTISHLFSTDYLKTINNKAFLGKVELSDFINASRLGDYSNSFEKAFAGTPLLSHPHVEQTLKKLLNEAITTLPDRHIARNAKAVAEGRTSLAVANKVHTAEELSEVVAKNNQLKHTVDQLLTSVKRTKKMKFLGYTVGFTLLVITAEDIYKKCVEISESGSGCFLYYFSNNEIKKCKVAPYSCLHGHKGDACTALLLTDAMKNCMDCHVNSNKKKACIHCSNDDERNAHLDDKHVLRCESPDALDVLLEGVNQTIGGIASAGGRAVSSLFSGMKVGLFIAALVIIVIIIIIIVVFMLR